MPGTAKLKLLYHEQLLQHDMPELREIQLLELKELACDIR